MRFTISLADKIIEINSLYDSTREFCREYLCEGQAELVVEVTPDDIAFERAKSKKEAQFEQLPEHDYKDAYLETLAVYRKIVGKLLEYDILLFHGSVIAVDGEGYLFTAKSGTGKSTHTKLWRQMFGDRAFMVNDDKPLIRLLEEGAIVYGTPWDGKHHLSTNTSVPLKAICILERDNTNHIEEITKAEALPMMLQQSYRPKAPAGMLTTMTLVERLGSNVRLFRLGCNMDPEAALVAYDGMK